MFQALVGCRKSHTRSYLYINDDDEGTPALGFNSSQSIQLADDLEQEEDEEEE